MYLGSAVRGPVCTAFYFTEAPSNLQTLQAAQQIIRGWRAHAQVAYSTESHPLTYESTTYARVARPVIFPPTTPTPNIPVTHSLTREYKAQRTMETPSLTSTTTDRAPEVSVGRENVNEEKSEEPNTRNVYKVESKGSSIISLFRSLWGGWNNETGYKCPICLEKKSNLLIYDVAMSSAQRTYS